MVDSEGGEFFEVEVSFSKTFYFISCVFMQFTGEAQFMNAKHNLEFPSYILTLVYLIVDTVTVLNNEAHKNV